MKIEELQEQIKQKRNEISDLNYLINEVGKEKYKFLIGKCYRLASTSCIKIIDIISIEDRYDSVCVECIKIQGGKYDCGKIEVTIKDDYNLRFIDIDEQRITEISKEKFSEFLEEALSFTRNEVLSIL